MCDNDKKNKEARERYKIRLKNKKCKICFKDFFARDKQVTCSKECTKKSKLNGMKIFYHIKFCKYCNKEILRIKKFGTKSKEKKIKGICKECSNTRKELRRTGELYRPKKTDRKRGARKIKEKKFSNREDYLKYLKDVGNRLGKNKEIKDKGTNTLKNNLLIGKTKYKKGKEHHLWKGNRDNNHFIRSRLTEWKKNVLIKGFYKCSNCGDNKKLEIHHVEPLRDIIDKFTKKPLSKYEQDSQEFENLCKVIVEYHEKNNNIGIVLCEKCHSEIDSYRRQTLKNENKKNKKI